MSVAAASEAARPRRPTDPQFGDVRVVVLRVAVDPERVMVGEQEEGKPVKAHHRRGNEAAKTPSTFPTSVCIALGKSEFKCSLVFQQRSAYLSEIELGEGEQWSCWRRRWRLEKMSPAEKKVRLRMGEQEIDLPPRMEKRDRKSRSRISWP